MEVFLTKSVLVCAKTFQFHEHKYQRRNLKMLLSLICLIFLDFLDIFDFLDFLDFFEKKLKKKKIWKKKFDENLKKWLENHWRSHKNIIWNWKYLFYSKFHWSVLVCAGPRCSALVCTGPHCLVHPGSAIFCHSIIITPMKIVSRKVND